MSQGGPLSSSNSIPTDVVITITGNTGSGSAIANNFDIVGTGSISTSVIGDTLTISNSASIPTGIANNQVLQSVIGLPPVWSTATYPATTTANQLLVSTSANVVGGLTAGTNGQVLIGSTGAIPSFSTLTSTGGTVTFTAGAGTLNLESVNSSLKITTYETSDSPATWTKDARTKVVEVYGWGGGGGGASGRKGTTALSGGGSGGGAGGAVYFKAPASFFGPTETVIIGAGGTGGVARSADNTSGANGAVGTLSRFGTNITTANSSISLAGSTANVGGAVGVAYSNFAAISTTGPTSGAGSITLGGTGGAATTNTMPFLPTGGGGGGGGDTAVTRLGGPGGSRTGIINGGIAGNEATIINGGNGNVPLSTGGILVGGTGGGGGGGYRNGASGNTTAGNGGTGAIPGGGGGGGGGGISGVANSGAGGNGGNGRVIVIEYF